MEWYEALILILGTLLLLLATAMPVALCFMVVNIIGIFIWWGGDAGLRQLILSMRESITTFTLLPIPLFILMGELMFQSGIGARMISAVEKWMGRVPGRLSLLAVAAGTIFGTMSGSSLAGAALLGSTILPEMEKQGYKKAMTLGPIMGSGCLAVMIPPSNFAVVLGAIAEISIAKLLIAIIVPGLLISLVLACYIMIRCYIQPSLAPVYKISSISLSQKVRDTVYFVLPLSFILIVVIGFMFWGIASPSEAAASGTLASFILAAVYRKLSWDVLKKSAIKTAELTVMILFIVACAKAYSQILAFSGASKGLGEFATNLVTVDPILIIIGMAIVLLILGMFMPVYPIMMITVPLFMPIVIALGYNTVWFGVIFILCMEVGAISPPFGMVLFVLKGVSPPGTTMQDCFMASLPICALNILVLGLILAFPIITLWLPSIMH